MDGWLISWLMFIGAGAIILLTGWWAYEDSEHHKNVTFLLFATVAAPLIAVGLIGLMISLWI